MNKSILVAVGGAVGAAARYWLGLVINSLGLRFPLGTFVANITGSFVIGFLMAFAGERMTISPNWRLLIGTGFIGAYTTFSTFEYETLKLVEDGRLSSAALNVILSVVVGFIAVWLGSVAGRRFSLALEVAWRF